MRAALGWDANECGRVEQLISFVHPDASVREAAEVAQLKLQSYYRSLLFQPELYHAVSTFAESAEATGLEGEEAHLLAATLRDFRHAGHELDPEQKERLKRLMDDIDRHNTEFLSNIFGDQATLTLTETELEGLPSTFVDGLARSDIPEGADGEASEASDGAFVVGVKDSHVNPILEYARRREVRERVWRAYNSVAMGPNRALLEQLMAERQEAAGLLRSGQDVEDRSWAAFKLEDRMAGTPEAVEQFHAAMLEPLTSRAQIEIDAMEALLVEDGYHGPIQAYDIPYYMARLNERESGVSMERITEYLPLDAALEGLFAITSVTFGVECELMPGEATWHPDVRTYAIRDSATGQPIAKFYLDLFPREGKFTHAATASLESGRMLPDGSRLLSVSALAANFSTPTNGRPALLSPAELKTLFHEFGHVLHNSLPRALTERFAGSNTEGDFVEAPSQIMEHWSRSAGVVQGFAHHFQTGETIPRELIEGLSATEQRAAVFDALRLLRLGIFDMTLHNGSQPKDLEDLYTKATAISLCPVVEGTFWPARFLHIAGGYDAGYYGYLWSKVFGDDMFSRFAAGGLTNPVIGREYREKILERGGTIPAAEMLRDFLGRDPTDQAFMQNLGISHV